MSRRRLRLTTHQTLRNFYWDMCWVNNIDMKFSFEWLQELIKFNQSPEQLAEILTLYLAETTVSYCQKRAILEVDFLPNRMADASNHLGLAREIGAILGKSFKYPQPQFKENKVSTKHWIKITNKSQYCRQYVSRSIWRIKVKPSPQWLKNRLIDCGLRPINNIVDAANYIMLLTGQPLHVFDFQKVAFNKKSQKEIIIRQAKLDEKITTLEGKTYTLDKNNLLICDLEKPLAIAGIKGGMAAEVDNNTKFIILESANFNPVNIRLTSRGLGLKTDASMRFEHDLKPALTEYAIDMLTQLIYELAGGDIILRGKSEAKAVKTQKIIFPINFKSWEKFLGWPIKKSIIIKKLSLLGFGVSQRKDYLLVAPPLFRNDITTIEDVMAEVARLTGFNNMPSKVPQEAVILPPKNEFWEFIKKIKEWLKVYHLEEVYTYSLISQKDKEILPKFGQSITLELKNPLSDLYRYLRPTLLINLLKTVANNFRFTDSIRFFEIGTIYQDTKIKENTVFGGILARKEINSKQPLFYEVKGIVEGIFNDLGIDVDDYSTKPIRETEYNHLLEKGLSLFSDNSLLGVIGVPRKVLYQHYDLEGEVVFWEINLPVLMSLEQTEREFLPLPQYPAAIRDISFIINKDILIDKILRTIQDAALYLEDADLFDIYEKGNISGDKQSLSFHLIFRSSNKTLTNTEVDKEMKKISQALTKLGANIR